MGYTWFRAEAAAVDHPKVMELATELKIKLVHADGLVFRLWSWVHRYAPTGVFSARAVPQIEAYVTAGEGPEGVLTAMQQVGLLDTCEGPNTALEVHDWWDLQGALVEKAEKDSKRKRQFRAQKRRADGARRSTGQRAPVRGTARVHDVTDETVQNETDEKKIRADKPRAPEKPPEPKPEKPPPDPRHAPLVKALTDRFEAITGTKYPFAPRDAKAVSQLLALALPPSVVAAWDRALKHIGFPTVRTLSELVTHFAHFVAAAPPQRGAARADDATKGEGTITAKEIQI